MNDSSGYKEQSNIYYILSVLAILAFLVFMYNLLKPPPTQKEIFQQAKVLYDQGQYAEALLLYQKLAEQGDADAQYYLGVMYNKGQGLAKDANQAVYWYRKAAEQGNATAQNNLGAICNNSFVVDAKPNYMDVPESPQQQKAYQKYLAEYRAGKHFGLTPEQADAKAMAEKENDWLRQEQRRRQVEEDNRLREEQYTSDIVQSQLNPLTKIPYGRGYVQIPNSTRNP